MPEVSSQIWWSEISGPASLIKEAVLHLQEGHSVLLYVPEELPWRKQMRSSVENMLREIDSDLFFEYIDCETERLDKLDVPSFLLERFADSQVRINYRASSGIPLFAYLKKHNVLKNRVLWIKGPDKCHTKAWHAFCKNYQTGTRYGGLFVIETCERLPGGGSSHIPQLPYQQYVSYYDALLFNSRISSMTTCSVEWKQYMATAASQLCSNDAELSESLILNTDFTKTSPIDALKAVTANMKFAQRRNRNDADELHPCGLPRCANDEWLETQLWKAQLQVLFPLIELERISFIEVHGGKVKEAMRAPFCNYITGTEEYVTQDGEPLTEPYDTEIGTLYRMSRLRQAHDDTKYLLFLPDEKERERLSLLRDIRNSLAHLKTCTVSEITAFLSAYPYPWQDA